MYIIKKSRFLEIKFQSYLIIFIVKIRLWVFTILLHFFSFSCVAQRQYSNVGLPYWTLWSSCWSNAWRVRIKSCLNKCSLAPQPDDRIVSLHCWYINRIVLLYITRSTMNRLWRWVSVTNWLRYWYTVQILRIVHL